MTILVLFPAGNIWALNEATLTSVTGIVQIKNAGGKISRIAKKNSTVLEGERIVTGKDSKATLQLFDGSQIDISPNTDFQLAKMQQPSPKDKILQFKLFLGELFAKAKKLASSKSSFEIEAGGVVCGVRGTQFRVKYDPTTNTVDLGVLDGTVYAVSNGQTTDFGPGSNVVFQNGVAVSAGNNGSSPPGAGAGNGQGGGNDAVQASLFDFNNQFTGNTLVSATTTTTTAANGNENTITNPSVTSTYQNINVTANVPGGEYVP